MELFSILVELAWNDPNSSSCRFLGTIYSYTGREGVKDSSINRDHLPNYCYLFTLLGRSERAMCSW